MAYAVKFLVNVLASRDRTLALFLIFISPGLPWQAQNCSLARILALAFVPGPRYPLRWFGSRGLRPFDSRAVGASVGRKLVRELHLKIPLHFLY
jgi:hypothetical protein